MISALTLESDPGDQPLFAQQHPKQARGIRLFSLDGYASRPGPRGQRIAMHSTYRFFAGEPS